VDVTAGQSRPFCPHTYMVVDLGEVTDSPAPAEAPITSPVLIGKSSWEDCSVEDRARLMIFGQ
jgi:hypothetical protein